jgi:hypothetical protein
VAIDYWKLSKDFKPGDLVQKFMPGRSEVSPYMGRVIAVMQGIGFLDVQWPFGAERVSPEEVVKVNPEFVRFLPPTLNFSYYPGYDAAPPKTASGQVWRTTEVPPDFHKQLARLFHAGSRPLQAYNELWHQFRSADDEAMRDEVSKFYRVAYNLVTALILEQAGKKDAAYWAGADRKYRATKDELANKKLGCPNCKGGPMRRATYKMESGQRVKLLACTACMHLVKTSDVLGPQGEPVEW